ncbi:hypothetical protein A2U04_05610 [Fusobacterium necrophorum subsp. funduliforme]|uniref:MipA/OmpV family protein n=1 Tax=Fusobacterium necrophorum TaxID=859 RepID=UPI000787A244|nr:MipA/OmpV family protein [Fusobacterium necrophorum]KYM48202.1 hypothetical protein A2U04_05610 [Fusobacterium necrophorum subsp. funduliforme]
MKKICILGFFIISSFSFANTIGIAGVYREPLHHAKSTLSALPIVQIEYKDFYFKNYKAGFYFYQEPGFKASILVNPLGGYIDFAIQKSNLKEGYQDISHRNIQFMVGLALDFQLDKRTVGHGEYMFGHYGSMGEMKINQVYKLHDRVTFLPGLSFHYYDTKYMHHYIGISKEEVTKNEKIKQSYHGKDTISGGVNATVEFALTEQVACNIFAGVEAYNHIKESDLVKKSHQIYGGIGFRVSF